MIANDEKTADTVEKKTEEEIRKPYKKPCLEELGDLRSLTLGSSAPGIDDPSGDFNTDDPFT